MAVGTAASSIGAGICNMFGAESEAPAGARVAGLRTLASDFDRAVDDDDGVDIV